MEDETLTVQISKISAEDIFKNILLDDYYRTLENVADMKLKLDTLDDYQKENYKHDKMLLASMKTMIKYYFAQSEWPEGI